MLGKAGEWVPLALFGPRLLIPFMRCDEPSGSGAECRDWRLRQQHEAGDIAIRRYVPAAGDWYEVAPYQWERVDFDIAYLIDADDIAFDPIEVRVIKPTPQNDHQRRIELLRQAWLSAGCPAVWARSNPSGWTAAHARDEVLERHSRIVWDDRERFERIPDQAIKQLLHRVTLRQLGREFSLARADIKSAKGR
jgi:hypothetical protein